MEKPIENKQSYTISLSFIKDSPHTELKNIVDMHMNNNDVFYCFRNKNVSYNYRVDTLASIIIEKE